VFTLRNSARSASSAVRGFWTVAVFAVQELTAENAGDAKF
jgi:hypothetical protein